MPSLIKSQEWAHIDSQLFVPTLLTFALVGASVLVHYEALNILNKGVHQLPSKRLALVATMFGLLLAHVVEIWLFAGGYWLATNLELGGFTPGLTDAFDTVYYSAMVYTTVGFGDLVPSGGLRMITSGEAVTGLSLITWSASFAFLQMQKVWEES